MENEANAALAKIKKTYCPNFEEISKKYFVPATSYSPL